MKSSNYLKTLLGISVFFLSLHKIKGQFLNPPIEALPEPPDGVSVEPEGVNMRINILENVPQDPIIIEPISPCVRIAKIRPTDPNTASIEIYFTNVNLPQDPFKIDRDAVTQDWYLCMQQGVDYDNLANDRVTMQLRDLTSGNFASFVIVFEDVNDNPVQITEYSPALKDDYAEKTIYSDNGELGYITTVLWSDRDAIDKLPGSITFELEHTFGGDGFFRIDATGKIYQIKEMDYQNSPTHRLRIRVYDSGRIHNNSIPLTIDVRDIPDLDPVWNSLPPMINIDEFEVIPVDPIVTTIRASDGDTGLGWNILYELVETGHEGIASNFFEINPTSGAITVVKVIDAEELFYMTANRALTFELEVTAREDVPSEFDPSLGRSISETITVNIRDTNDNDPEVCTAEDIPWNTPCSSTPPYVFNLVEHSVGSLPLPTPFVIRDLDATLPYSKYGVKFADNTDPRISNSFDIQPSRESSGVTEYVLSVKDSSAIDYESDDQFWLSSPTRFTITATDTDPLSGKSVDANFELTLQDVNDNGPIFEDDAGQPVLEYRFYVCENLDPSYTLQKIVPESPKLCPGEGTGGNPIKIIAKDKDVSEQFHTVNYRWSSTRLPPLDLNPVTGEMTVNNAGNFDFERLDQEVYLVEAFDNPTDPNNQRKESIAVIFEVLDKNDSPPDLRITPSRLRMDENAPVDSIVPDVQFTAADVDVSASLDLELQVQSLVKNADNYVNADCPEILEWFELANIDRTPGSNGLGQILTAQLKIGQKSPDREACGGVERVDLTLIAIDRNQEPVNGMVSQTLTIIIDDVNDSDPVWEGTSPIEAAVLETAEFTEAAPDTATPLQREIVTLRATDPDAGVTDFKFSVEARDCVSACDEMIQLIDLDDGNSGNGNTNGRVILRRRLNVTIDREETKFYNVKTDFLYYTLTVSDGSHESTIDVSINVLDINDNPPVWERDFSDPRPFVIEKGSSLDPIVTFQATDADAGNYGTVNYIFTEESLREGIETYFDLNVNTGELLPKPDAYSWSATDNSHTFVVRAIDNYRPGVNVSSNWVPMTITVDVVDSNDHPPEFIREPDALVASEKETQVKPNTPLTATPEGALEIRDQDDPNSPDRNGVFSNGVVITKITKEKGDGEEEEMDDKLFRVRPKQLLDPNDNRWEFDILPGENMNPGDFVGKWGVYSVTFQAKDEGIPFPLESEPITYKIKIINENLNPPVFQYPDPSGDSTILVGTSNNTLPDTPVKTFNGMLVPPILAEDQDDEENGNGKLTYSIKPNPEDPNDGSEFFDVKQLVASDEGWTLVLKKSLEDSTDVRFYMLTIEVQDNPTDPAVDPFTAEAKLKIFLTTGINRQPLFNDTSPQTVIIPENKIGFQVSLREALDPDEGLIEENPDYPELGELIGDQSIEYKIIDGSVENFADIFEIIMEAEKASISTKRILDREHIDRYELTVQVKNPGSDNIQPDPRGSITIIIEVEDEIDNHPQFVQTGVISGGISQTTDQRSVVVTIEVTDLDKDDPVTFSKTEATPSNPDLPANPVEIYQNGTYLAYIIITFAPQPSMTGYYTFELTATDSGGLSTIKEVKIYFIKPSNVVDFRFFNRRDQIEEKRARLSEILTDSFGYRCNVDRINDDGNNVNLTILKTHFVDLVKNEPVEAVYISEQQYDPLTYSKLLTNLAAEGIVLNSNGIGNQDSPESSNSDKLMIYLLIGGVGVLAIVLIVMSTTCFFNNRSLQRRVRSLTATTFGSQSSGLNRVGATMELPNTNEFAIEGSNPMWSTNPADREKNIPAFDAESIGSGGSVLIGVEDDDDFKNYKGTANPTMDSNGNLDDSDEDYTQDIYDNNTPSKNALYESDNVSNDSDGSSPPALSLPPTSRRNPLLDM